jgi:hypothetical protein
VFNPCTRKSANMGHPSRGQGLVASRDTAVDEMTAEVVHSSFNLPKASQLLGMTKKVIRVLWYPTQAKTGLEWGTQRLLTMK